MVVEVRPPVDADKGTAVQRLAAGYGAVAYAGDDLGDLPAFAAVRGRGGPPAGALAVAVDHGAETDPRVRAAADLVVAGPEGALAWLERVASVAGRAAGPGSVTPARRRGGRP
jgi:trehalose 6-phosphate phosphatase